MASLRSLIAGLSIQILFHKATGTQIDFEDDHICCYSDTCPLPMFYQLGNITLNLLDTADKVSCCGGILANQITIAVAQKGIGCVCEEAQTKCGVGSVLTSNAKTCDGMNEISEAACPDFKVDDIDLIQPLSPSVAPTYADLCIYNMANGDKRFMTQRCTRMLHMKSINDTHASYDHYTQPQPYVSVM